MLKSVGASNLWKYTLIISFIFGIASGVWMSLTSSPTETSKHSIELKHSWVQLEQLIILVLNMLIATLAIYRLKNSNKS